MGEQDTYAEATGTAILIRGKAFRGLGPLGLATLDCWSVGSAAASLVLFTLRALGAMGGAGEALGAAGGARGVAGS